MNVPKVGQQFGNYVIRAELGKGGFGVVLRADDGRRGIPVALKILLPDDDGGYSARRELRFEREVTVLQRLSSTHTVKLLEYGRAQDGLLFMVFELVGGRDLTQMMEGAPWPAEIVRRIMLQVLDSLEEAHDAGVLHRDIKPANIRVFREGDDPYRVKLLDFGIAKPTDAAGPQLTATGQVVGTMRFLAPERLYGEDMLPSSDLFSLALVMLELLTGRPTAHLATILNGRRIELQPDETGDSQLARVLTRMLEAKPDARYTRAADVRRALGETLTQTVEVTADDPPARVGAWSLAAGAAALVCVGALGWFMTRSQPEPQPAARRLPHALRTVGPPATVAEREPQLSPDLGRIEPDVGPDVGPDAAADPRTGGCGLEPPFVGRNTLSFVTDMRQGSVLTYVPKSYDPAKPAPLLVLVHQFLSNGGEFLNLTGYEKMADKEGFLIIAPDGGRVYPWNRPEDIANVHAAINGARQHLCVDDSRIYGLGHGDGGSLVEQMPCTMPVAAIATTAFRNRVGRETCDWDATRPVPYIFLTPTEDRYNPIEGGFGCGDEEKISLADKETLWRARQACTGSPKTRKIGTSKCFEWTCEEPLISCHVDGGHDWPGAKKRLIDFQNCDGTPADFPYAQTIWKFLSAHRAKR